MYYWVPGQAPDQLLGTVTKYDWIHWTQNICVQIFFYSFSFFTHFTHIPHFCIPTIRQLLWAKRAKKDVVSARAILLEVQLKALSNGECKSCAIRAWTCPINFFCSLNIVRRPTCLLSGHLLLTNGGSNEMFRDQLLTKYHAPFLQSTH